MTGNEKVALSRLLVGTLATSTRPLLFSEPLTRSLPLLRAKLTTWLALEIVDSRRVLFATDVTAVVVVVVDILVEFNSLFVCCVF